MSRTTTPSPARAALWLVAVLAAVLTTLSGCASTDDQPGPPTRDTVSFFDETERNENERERDEHEADERERGENEHEADEDERDERDDEADEHEADEHEEDEED